MDTVTAVMSLCRLDEIPDGGASAVELPRPVDGSEPDSLILLRQGDQVRAYRNICPHAGRRLDYAPGKFLLKDRTLICAVHGASFDRDDGLCVGGPCRGEHLRAVAVQVMDGMVRLAS